MHAAMYLQARFTLKTGKFEGVREDEAEALETDLAPQTSDTLRCAEGECVFGDCCIRDKAACGQTPVIPALPLHL